MLRLGALSLAIVGTAAWICVAVAAEPSAPVRVAQAANAPKKKPPIKTAQAKPADAAPLSRDELFGNTGPKAAPSTKKTAQVSKDELFGTSTPAKNAAPASKDELFGATTPAKEASPASKDELFGTAATATGATAAASKDELFGSDAPPAKSEVKQSGIKYKGFINQETAYTYADPAHWSRAVFRAQLSATGRLGDNAKWKATVRGDVDPVYFVSDFYNDAVKQDQRTNFLVGETYIDTSVKGVDLRLGRQNIVWGEVVGFFVADVVSAKDTRDFLLPSFDIIRIPQWAARAEYFFGDSHVEAIWIPYNTYDNIGKPGADFFPIQAPPPPGFQQQFLGEVIPTQTLANSNYGGRLTTLKAGWDLSAFYYQSTDATPTFERQITLAPTPTITYQARHDRIWQSGGTFSKDLGSAVLKGEAVYTDGRSSMVSTPTNPTGLVPQNTWDWVLGLDINLPRDTRLNVQGFQRIYSGYDPQIYFDRIESGASVLLNVKLVQKWEAEVLFIGSINRTDYLLRPRVIWRPKQNLRVAMGVDIFDGPAFGVFGRFSARDRVYVETRYDF